MVERRGRGVWGVWEVWGDKGDNNTKQLAINNQQITNSSFRFYIYFRLPTYQTRKQEVFLLLPSCFIQLVDFPKTLPCG